MEMRQGGTRASLCRHKMGVMGMRRRTGGNGHALKDSLLWAAFSSFHFVLFRGTLDVASASIGGSLKWSGTGYVARNNGRRERSFRSCPADDEIATGFLSSDEGRRSPRVTT